MGMFSVLPMVGESGAKDLDVVLLELHDALIGQGVLDHLLDDLEGDGGDVGAGPGAAQNVAGVADGGGDDLGGDLRIEGEDVGDVLNQSQAVLVDVVQTADEGADIGGAGPGGQQSLVGAENQGAVGGDALGGQHLDGLQALGGHGNLDDHVLGVDGVDGAALFDHALGIHGGGLDLTGDGAVDDGADLLQGLSVVAALLGDQAGVGGDAADDAHLVGLADFLHVGGIQEQFHVVHLFLSLPFRSRGREAFFLPHYKRSGSIYQ